MTRAHSLHRNARAFAVIALFSIAPKAVAGDRTDWQKTAIVDLAAAEAVIENNHPAAQAVIKDFDFRRRLAAASRRAESRARSVRDEAGYRAILRGFATDLGDPHIAMRFKYPPTDLRWAGLTFRYAKGQFLVSHAEMDLPPWLEGARLLDCDGVSARSLARTRLGGFSATWWLNAERIQASPRLLVDESNPFLQRPRTCRFIDRTGRSHKQTLAWRTAQPALIADLASREVQRFGTAKDGLSWHDGIAWIGMRAMDESADPTIATVLAQHQRVSQSDALLIDLRGNGGGSSRKGDELLAAITGDSAAMNDEQSDSHWRATPLVLETIEGYSKERSDLYGADSEDAREWRDEAAQLRQAMGHGDLFAPPLASQAPGPAFAKEPMPKNVFSRPVFVLTDSICVSSCLMFVARLRGLGAHQIGWETNASQRYMEVRGVALTSGKASISILQKVDLRAPLWFGPFRPDITAPAEIANADQAEAWALTTVKASIKKPHR